MVNQSKHDYYIKNRDRILAQRKEYRLSHADEIREKKRLSYYNDNGAYKARIAKWNKLNPERRKEVARNYYWRNRAKVLAGLDKTTHDLKAKVIEMLGGKCVCCSDMHFEFLSVDHIHGSGARDRRNYGLGRGFYRAIITGKRPTSDLRLLCLNCNLSRGWYGYCPHEKE